AVASGDLVAQMTSWVRLGWVGRPILDSLAPSARRMRSWVDDLVDGADRSSVWPRADGVRRARCPASHRNFPKRTGEAGGSVQPITPERPRGRPDAPPGVEGQPVVAEKFNRRYSQGD